VADGLFASTCFAVLCDTIFHLLLLLLLLLLLRLGHRGSGDSFVVARSMTDHEASVIYSHPSKKDIGHFFSGWGYYLGGVTAPHLVAHYRASFTGFLANPSLPPRRV